MLNKTYTRLKIMAKTHGYEIDRFLEVLLDNFENTKIIIKKPDVYDDELLELLKYVWKAS